MQDRSVQQVVKAPLHLVAIFFIYLYFFTLLILTGVTGADLVNSCWGLFKSSLFGPFQISSVLPLAGGNEVYRTTGVRIRAAGQK